MSHDPNNKDCKYFRSEITGVYIPCTCPPAVDEVEQIRESQKDRLAFRPIGALHENVNTLLRIVDQLRAELVAAQSELERVRADNDMLWREVSGLEDARRPTNG